MRLWSLHPSHLDRVGLVACWREALLAQAVLDGKTRGYRRHPQLERFRDCADPLAAIGAYLSGLLAEAQRLQYRFDATKIRRPLALPEISGSTAKADGFSGSTPLTPGGPSTRRSHPRPSDGGDHSSGQLDAATGQSCTRIPVARGQLEHEWSHLGAKLRQRSPVDAARWRASRPSAHPLFIVRPGPVEPWERP